MTCNIIMYTVTMISVIILLKIEHLTVRLLCILLSYLYNVDYYISLKMDQQTHEYSHSMSCFQLIMYKTDAEQTTVGFS